MVRRNEHLFVCDVESTQFCEMIMNHTLSVNKMTSLFP